MQKYLPAFLLILLGIASRLLPHPANFAPIAAIALFSGIYLPKKFALTIPLIAMALSDIVLGSYHWQVMVTVYIAFIFTALIGLALKNHKRFTTVLGGTLLASIIFFITTNTAVWAFTTMYPHSATGLGQSFLMAIPFFKNSLLGDLFYTGVLVGGMELILNYQTNKNLKTTSVV